MRDKVTYKGRGKKSSHSSRPSPKQDGPNIRARDKNTIRLDGSTLEGGGQLVRLALLLSAITRIPIHITNIRAGRGGGRNAGGLKESHLAALEILADECGATVEGGSIASKEILFEPEKQGTKVDMWSNSKRTIELRNPGSVWLILQALLPWYLLQGRPAELTLHGGTNVSSSMSGDYVQQVFLPTLAKIGLRGIHLEVVQRGWAGNASQIGEVKVSIDGNPTPIDNAPQMRTQIPSFNIQDRGLISKISITILAHPESMRAALSSRAHEELARKFPTSEIETMTDEDSLDPRRVYILLVAHTTTGWRLGRDYLGTGKTLKTQAQTDALVDGAVRTVVHELADEIKANGCVDEYLQDQLVVFQALASGRSAVDAGEGREEGTLHTQTVRWVCDEMLGELGFECNGGGECVGVGARLIEKGVNLDVEARINTGNGVGQLAEAVAEMHWKDSN